MRRLVTKDDRAATEVSVEAGKVLTYGQILDKAFELGSACKTMSLAIELEDGFDTMMVPRLALYSEAEPALYLSTFPSIPTSDLRPVKRHDGAPLTSFVKPLSEGSQAKFFARFLALGVPRETPVYIALAIYKSPKSWFVPMPVRSAGPSLSISIADLTSIESKKEYWADDSVLSLWGEAM